MLTRTTDNRSAPLVPAADATAAASGPHRARRRPNPAPEPLTPCHRPSRTVSFSSVRPRGVEGRGVVSTPGTRPTHALTRGNVRTACQRVGCTSGYRPGCCYGSTGRNSCHDRPAARQHPPHTASPAGLAEVPHGTACRRKRALTSTSQLHPHFHDPTRHHCMSRGTAGAAGPLKRSAVPQRPSITRSIPLTGRIAQFLALPWRSTPLHPFLGSAHSGGRRRRDGPHHPPSTAVPRL